MSLSPKRIFLEFRKIILKLFRLPEQRYVWKSLTTEIIWKLINFLFFFLHFCEFPPALNSSKGDKCSPIREEKGSIPHFGTPSRKDSHTVAETLKKVLIFEDQVRWCFKKEIRRKKSEGIPFPAQQPQAGLQLSHAMGSAPDKCSRSPGDLK